MIEDRFESFNLGRLATTPIRGEPTMGFTSIVAGPPPLDLESDEIRVCPMRKPGDTDETCEACQ
jgi:hypothetical protein